MKVEIRIGRPVSLAELDPLLEAGLAGVDLGACTTTGEVGLTFVAGASRRTGRIEEALILRCRQAGLDVVAADARGPEGGVADHDDLLEARSW